MSLLANTDATYSMRRRLVLAFGVLLVVFLGFAGYVLDRAFQGSVAAAVAERLQLQVYALLGVAEPETSGKFFLPDLEEARFSQIDSGLYGFIFDRSGRELWRSPSALNLNVEPSPMLSNELLPGQTSYGEQITVEQGPLAWASYRTYWESLDQLFFFVVMESTAPSTAEITEFQSNLYLWFGALTVLLSVAQYFLLRWGLRPLRQLAHDVSAIESGTQDQLQQHYPRELVPITHNLNLLIKSERERQNRFRTTLGDLAHSLKTPLAVLSTALQEAQHQQHFSAAQQRDMSEQLQRMDQIVSYQLKRAVKSNQALLARPVLLAPVVDRLVGALQKVYRDKATQVNLTLAEGVQFFGEETDLMELCGNLLDNAFKYGHSKVQVKALQKGKSLLLEINDDGTGIDEGDHHFVLQRGARADTVKSGQGIGLAVVAEIVSAYGGELRIERSDWGGASIKLRLG
jgi:two-component system, OmpR family, sensor histidine kinase PhoQ